MGLIGLLSSTWMVCSSKLLSQGDRRTTGSLGPFNVVLEADDISPNLVKGTMVRIAQ